MSDDEIYIAIEAYIAYFGGADIENIIRADNNYVPIPKSKDYVVMTLLNDSAICTPDKKFNPDELETNIHTRDQAVVQIDFYGKRAREQAKRIEKISRTLEGCKFLQEYNINPLFCDPAEKINEINSHNVYKNRWKVDLNISYDSNLVLKQDGFNKAVLSKIIAADLIEGE